MFTSILFQFWIRTFRNLKTYVYDTILRLDSNKLENPMREDYLLITLSQVGKNFKNVRSLIFRTNVKRNEHIRHVPNYNIFIVSTTDTS